MKEIPGLFLVSGYFSIVAQSLFLVPLFLFYCDHFIIGPILPWNGNENLQEIQSPKSEGKSKILINFLLIRAVNYIKIVNWNYSRESCQRNKKKPSPLKIHWRNSNFVPSSPSLQIPCKYYWISWNSLVFSLLCIWWHFNLLDI